MAGACGQTASHHRKHEVSENTINFGTSNECFECGKGPCRACDTCPYWTCDNCECVCYELGQASMAAAENFMEDLAKP